MPATTFTITATITIIFTIAITTSNSTTVCGKELPIPCLLR
jgi:hypothetical protein